MLFANLFFYFLDMNKNFKKILSFILILFFLVLFSYFKGWDFFDFYKQTKILEEQKKEVLIKASNFSLKKIREFNSVKFFYSPYKNLIDNLVYKINNAKKNVYLEVYIFTEKRLREALVKAKKRGVDVKVILEKHPYKSPNLNDKTFNFFKKNWVEVVWSNTKNFSLNHSKIILIDDEVFLSTWNFTYNTFTKNREFFSFIDDKKFFEILKKVFLADFYWKKNYIYSDNLILSPDYSRIKIEKWILQAKNNIKMYFPYIEDKKLEKILVKKEKSWVKIFLITWIDSLKNKEILDYLKKNKINIKFIKTPKIHAKAILIDDKYLYIWSINFSKYSFDENREIWAFFGNSRIIEKFEKVFEKDFYSN